MNITNLLRHISLKHLKLQKAQLFIALSGICLGVAAMVAIDIVNRSVLRSFEDSINHATGRAVLQVAAGESGFPEKMLDVVQGVPGVEYAVPVIETNAKLSGGTERAVMILGVDVLQDHQIRDYSITDESADIPDPLLFLARSDSILLTRSMAEREGIKIDQQIQVQTVEGIKTFQVRGLLNPDGPARVAGGDIAIMDIYAAQMAFGKEGRVDRIDVSLLRGEDFDKVKERIQGAVPEGYNIDTPAGRTRQVEMMLKRFQNSIGFVSLMVMFVGMYLIYNSVSISVVHRRKEIGIMRALGAKRGEIIRLFLGETLVTSAIASFIGVGLGLVFARLSIGVVAQSVTDIYMQASVTELAFSWGELIRDGIIGIIASLAAAAFPARSCARITPISAIRSMPYSEDGFLFGTKIKIASAALIILSFTILIAYKMAGNSSPLRTSGTTFAAALFLTVGLSLGTPLLLKWFLVFFHRYISPRLGAPGRLAGLNLQKNVSRNAVALAAVFFSISLLVSSVNAMNSTRTSIFEWIDSVIRADILIASGHPLSIGAHGIPMPGEMIKEIEEVPGVLTVEPFRKGYIYYNGRKVMLETTDIAMRMEYCPGMMAEGTRDDMVNLLPGQDNVVVNEGFATKYGVRKGDSIVLPTPDGPVRFGVAGIVVSYSSDSGVIWMDISTYRKRWHDNLVDMYEVRVKPGQDIRKVSGAILDRMGGERRLFALPALEFRNEIRQILDRSWAVTYAINTIVLVIAGFGIVITMLASVLERTREIGVLRSIGMKRSQVSGVVITESVLIGAAGGLLGAASGLLVGWIELEGFFRIDFGASMTYHIDYLSLAWALLLSAGLSALAGLYPAHRASKINIVEALRYE